MTRGKLWGGLVVLFLAGALTGIAGASAKGQTWRPELLGLSDEKGRSVAESDCPVHTAIRCGAKVIWMQEGIMHEEAAGRARQAGLTVVQDRCILKEHAKRFVTEGI